MTTNYISTQYLSSSLQLSVLKMQTELATAQAESASGQYADIGLQLGSQSGQEISLQNENGLLQTYTTTNSQVATSLSTTQSALSSLQTNAQNTLNNLTEWNGSTDIGSELQIAGRQRIAIPHRHDQYVGQRPICVRRHQFRQSAADQLYRHGRADEFAERFLDLSDRGWSDARRPSRRRRCRHFSPRPP